MPEDRNIGFVYIVGAGPGDPELITLKAKKVIRKADVILYDRLVNPKILHYARRYANKIYVGKEPKKERFPQSEINRLMLKYALKGYIVVRLKGGDPFIFGRGSEEAIFLEEHNIPFEIIPGITSAIGASAYAGIPLTHRSMVTKVVFLTAHEDPSKEESQLELEKIAKLENATIVVYMGATRLEDLVNELIKNGMNPNAQAAIVENATLAKQRTFTDTLENLPRIANEKNLKPPLLTIISPCVKFQKELSWFYKKPLFGKKIVTTRAIDQSKKLFQLLREEGAEIIPFPVFKTQGIQLDEEYLMSVLNSHFRWVIFTSQNGVRYFFENILSKNPGGFCIVPHIAALGPNTAAELKEYSHFATFTPENYNSKAFLEEFTTWDLKDKRILRVKGKFENDPITEELRKHCKEVVTLEVYEILKEEPSQQKINYLLNTNADAIIFTASITVKFFFEILGERQAKDFLNRVDIFAIGPMTQKALKEKGIFKTIVSEVHTIEGVVETMKNYYKSQNMI